MDNLKRYKKWLHNYIDNVDITNIEWLNLNQKELSVFFNNNYYDEKEYAFVFDGYYTVPFGLHYLTFNSFNYSYNCLLGVVDNNIGKKTIVAAMVYDEDLYLFEHTFLLLKLILILEIMVYIKECVMNLLKFLILINT